jgi:hypothetical protein
VAVSFESVWPVAAGTFSLDDIADRSLVMAPGRTKGARQDFWWNEDGTDGGYSSFGDLACPWCAVMMQDRTSPGAFGIVGCYGPVMSPYDSSQAGDLYCWTYAYDSGRWQMTIYAGGPDAATATLDGSGVGRNFVALRLGED